ncbi:DUF1727 domain-containing protein [bacterium]|nr:DUF1727 domain-containing protein [bacterium]
MNIRELVLNKLKILFKNPKNAKESSITSKDKFSGLCLSDFADYKIALSATCGKSTVQSVLKNIFEQNSKSVLSLSDLNFSQQKHDFLTVCVPEGKEEEYFTATKFDCILLANLFKNQNDETSIFQKKEEISKALLLNPKALLVVNADDAMLLDIDTLSLKRKKIFYGFNNIEFYAQNELIAQRNDIIKCPNCGFSLSYSKRYYSHLGDFSCECGFNRPKLDVACDARVFSDYSLLTVYKDDEKYLFKVPLGGVYNAYNFLLAITLALLAGFSRKEIAHALETYIPIMGRDDVITYKTKKVKIKIIKNSTTLSEAIREISASSNIKTLFCIEGDNTDNNWLWDANYKSFLNSENKIYLSGSTCYDLALCLKYEGVNTNRIVIEENLQNAIDLCHYELDQNETMLILTSPCFLQKIYTTLNNSLQ